MAYASSLRTKNRFGLCAEERKLEAYATKRKLEAYATERKLEAYATKRKLEAYATERKLEAYATERKLEAYATKRKLEAYATKLATLTESCPVFSWFKKRRRKKILAADWPEAWSLHLNRNVRLSWNLSESEMATLKNLIQVFVAEKHWEGCEGLALTDEMRVTIAANASLMLLGTDDFYFDNVRTILVYPQSFNRKTSDGMLHGANQHRSGEAWQGGPIVLSWRNALQGGRNEDDGQNVVIHEFAHALDGLDGEMGGSLMFDNDEATEQWSVVVKRDFQRLCADIQQGRATVIDPYGGTNLAEFFAVATETFFEQPQQLRSEYPELFSLLHQYFHVDPRSWQ